MGGQTGQSLEASGAAAPLTPAGAPVCHLAAYTPPADVKMWG